MQDQTKVTSSSMDAKLYAANMHSASLAGSEAAMYVKSSQFLI